MTIYHGDCRTILPTLPANSVQCVVTSPPYWKLRKYSNDPREIGQEETYQAYIAVLADVFRDVQRVLRNDGTLWLNLGDTYSASGRGGGGKQDTNKGSLGLPPVNVEDMAPKNLIGIPWRVAFALQDDGWILRSEIIWSKPNAMPESVKDRPTRAHEYLFLFSKQGRYFYDNEAIKELAVDGDPRPPRGSQETLSNGKPHANNGRRDKQSESGLSRYVGFNERWEGREPLTHRNARSVWSIATTPYADAHFATFPEALAERCIRAGSRAGDLVLDPFGGSGTVARVAERLGRSWALIELNQDYIELQERRTNGVQKELLV